MKKSVIKRLLSLLCAFVLAISLQLGFSNYIYGKYDTSDSINTSSNIGSTNQVTVTIKYDVVNTIVVPDWKYDTNDVSVSGTVSISIGDETKYTAIMNFLKDNTDFSVSDSIDKGTYYPNGKVNTRFSDYEFYLDVTTKIQTRGNHLKTYYGAYVLLFRKKSAYTYQSTTIDSNMPLIITKGSKIDLDLIKEKYLDSISSYKFVGIKEANTDGTPSSTYFDCSTAITANKTLFLSCIDTTILTGKVSIADLINANTGTLNVYSGSSSADVSSDYTYNLITKNVFLDKAVEVKSGTTTKLCLNDGNEHTEYNSETNTQLEPKVANLQYKVTLLDDMVVNGSLVIGADVGVKNSASLQGNILARYVELDLNGHNIIINSSGALKCYGLITDSIGSGDIKVYGGKIETLVVVEDYRGGTFTTKAIGSNVFPFSFYSIPYLRCKVSFIFTSTNGWGKLIAKCYLTVGFLGLAGIGSYASTTISLNFIGPKNTSDPFLFSSTTGVDKQSMVIVQGIYLSSRWRTKIELVNSSFTMESIKLSVTFGKTYSVDTKDLCFPISSFFDIVLTNSSLVFKQRMKFLCGSSFVANVNSVVAFGYIDADHSAQIIVMDRPITYYAWNYTKNEYIHITNDTFMSNYSTLSTTFLANNSRPQMKIYGKLVFISGNTKEYVLSGQIDFSETDIGYCSSENLSNCTYYSNLTNYSNPFAFILDNHGINFTTYGLDTILGAYNSSKEYFHNKALARPLISREKAYVVDSSYSMTGSFDSSSGVFVDENSTKMYYINTDGSFNLADSGSCSIKECTFDDATHIITDSNSSSTYVSFAGMCVPYNTSSKIVTLTRLTEASADQNSVVVSWNSDYRLWLK